MYTCDKILTLTRALSRGTSELREVAAYEAAVGGSIMSSTESLNATN